MPENRTERAKKLAQSLYEAWAEWELETNERVVPEIGALPPLLKSHFLGTALMLIDLNA